MGRMVRIRRQSLRVGAPAEIAFQVVSGAGRVIEHRSETERVVAFTATVNGREVVTTELVRLDPPELIEYEWIEGPLPSVKEAIAVEPIAERECELVYEGRFETPHGGLLGLIEGPRIRAMFERTVVEHLGEAKRIAEARKIRGSK